MVSVREAINLLVAVNVIMASQAPSVMADGGLRACCFAGAIGGGLVSVIFKPPETARQAAMKWLGSTILAVGLTPLIMAAPEDCVHRGYGDRDEPDRGDTGVDDREHLAAKRAVAVKPDLPGAAGTPEGGEGETGCMKLSTISTRYGWAWR